MTRESPAAHTGVDADACTAFGYHLPMQHPDWLQTAVQHLADGLDAVVFRTSAKARQSTHPSQPMLRSGARVPRLTLPGGPTGEPGDLVWSGQQDLAELARRLARQPLALTLPRVPAASPSIDALRQAFRGRGWLRVSPAVGTPYIDLDARWAEPTQHFNAGRRSDFRRAERHADKLGGLAFSLHDNPEGATLDRLLDEAYAVEAQSWKGQEGTALQHDRQLGPFFRDYAHAAARSGLLRLAFMHVGGQAVGMQISVVWQQRLWLLKIGYDPAYARCSPGNLLMLHAVGRAARDGLRSCEFLGNPAPWTTLWTTTLRACVQVRAYPASMPGTLAWLEDAQRYVHQRWRRTVTQPVPSDGPVTLPAPLDATARPSEETPA